MSYAITSRMWSCLLLFAVAAHAQDPVSWAEQQLENEQFVVAMESLEALRAAPDASEEVLHVWGRDEGKRRCVLRLLRVWKCAVCLCPKAGPRVRRFSNNLKTQYLSAGAGDVFHVFKRSVARQSMVEKPDDYDA